MATTSSTAAQRWSIGLVVTFVILAAAVLGFVLLRITDVGPFRLSVYDAAASYLQRLEPRSPSHRQVADPKTAERSDGAS